MRLSTMLFAAVFALVAWLLLSPFLAHLVEVSRG